MPVDQQNLEPEVFGSVTNQVLTLLSDNRGYYVKDLLQKIGCTPSHLYRVLGKLHRKGLILSKTLPGESEKQGKDKRSKVYYKTPQSRDLR
jgi:DNA-binding MarR family transcriptional regulator